MNRNPARRENDSAGPPPVAVPIDFSSLLYRFLFFDWLFADMSRTRNLFERRAAWQHNRLMRRHLPTYLRRWATLAVLAFGLGWVCERVFESTVVAAWLFTAFCVTFPVMAVIGAAWIFLSRPEMPWG